MRAMRVALTFTGQDPGLYLGDGLVSRRANLRD
jgi:hypothetical protein